MVPLGFFHAGGPHHHCHEEGERDNEGDHGDNRGPIFAKDAFKHGGVIGFSLATNGFSRLGMVSRLTLLIWVESIGLLFFQTGVFVGSQLLHIGNHRDDLAISEVVPQIVSTEVLTIRQESQVLQGFCNRKGLFPGILLDLILGHGRVGHPEATLGRDFPRERFEIGLVLEELGIRRHIGAGRELSGIKEVVKMPQVVPFALADMLAVSHQGSTFAGQIGSRPF